MNHRWVDHPKALDIEVCRHCGLQRRRTSARSAQGPGRTSIFMYRTDSLSSWGVRYKACPRSAPRGRDHRLEWARRIAKGTV